MQLTKQIIHQLILEELEKGAAYMYKSKKGKESTVKVVDPKNEYGATVVTKVNPETLDPLSKRVFAVNPEKFEASAKPVQSAAGVSNPQSEQEKEFDQQRAEWEKKDKEREAKFKKEMEEQKLLDSIMKGIYNKYMAASNEFRKTNDMKYYEMANNFMKVFNTYVKWMNSGNEEQVLKQMKNFAKHA